MSDKYFRVIERGTVNVVFVPDGWPIEMVETFDDDFKGWHLAWGPTMLVSNDPRVDTLYYDPAKLTDEISEAAARRIHPALFEHLAKVNRGEVA